MSDFQNPGWRSIKDWKRAEGHGSFDWLKERFSSLALLPLTAWALLSVFTLSGGGFERAHDFMTKPHNMALFGTLLIISIWHGHMGLRVIIDDYFPTGTWRKISLFAAFFLMLSLLIGGIGALYILIRASHGQ